MAEIFGKPQNLQGAERRLIEGEKSCAKCATSVDMYGKRYAWPGLSTKGHIFAIFHAVSVTTIICNKNSCGILKWTLH